MLKGEIEEREKAFEKYEEAMSKGDGAFLLDEERPDLFQLSIGNMPPKSDLVVRLRYLLPATRDGKGLRLMLPTSITPRYSPVPLTPEAAAEIERTTPPYAESVPYGLTLCLEFEMESAIRVIDSPSHRIRSEINGTKARITFSQESTAMDRDFVLSLETSESEPLCGSLAMWRNRGYVMAEFRADLPEPETPTQRKVVFLIDCSGSMWGDSIAEAKRAVELCIRALNEGDLFQIVCFGSDYRFLFPEYQTFSQQTLERAIREIARIDADMGGTEILPAIQAVFGGEEKGLSQKLLDSAVALVRGRKRTPAKAKTEPNALILMTDGAVSNEDEILAYVKKHASRTRIFSFAIGAGAGQYLVKGLARQSRGAFEAIFPGERIEPKVLRQFGRIDSPMLDDVRIDWGGLEAEMAPAEVPPVFSSEPLLVIARLSAGANLPKSLRVKLSGMLDGRRLSWEAAIRPTEDGEMIARHWARRAIQEIEDGVEFSEVSGRKCLRESDLVGLSKEYGVLCRNTSLIAIEERSEEQKTKTRAELRRIPVLVTTGWHGGKAPMGAGSGILSTLASVAHSVMPLYSMSTLNHQTRMGSAASKKVCCCREVDSDTDGLALPTGGSRREKASVWYLDLLQLQLADGSFPPSPQFASLLGVADADLQTWASLLSVSDRNLADTALATALAVALLRKRAADAEPTWKKAAKKAVAWLHKHAVRGEGGSEVVDWLTAKIP